MSGPSEVLLSKADMQRLQQAVRRYAVPASSLLRLAAVCGLADLVAMRDADLLKRCATTGVHRTAIRLGAEAGRQVRRLEARTGSPSRRLTSAAVAIGLGRILAVLP